MPDFAFLSFDRPTFTVQKGRFSLFLKLHTYSLLHKVTKRLMLYTSTLLSHKLLNELRIKDYSALIC